MLSVSCSAIAQSPADSRSGDAPPESPALVAPSASPSPTPATATPAPTSNIPSAATTPAHILYPANGVAPVSAHGLGETPGTANTAMSFLALLGLCAGGYYLLRRRSGFASSDKGLRKLNVSETRSLGNRQFLVVVEYENERVLLGVTPGKIDYLCPLPSAGKASNIAFEEHGS